MQKIINPQGGRQALVALCSLVMLLIVSGCGRTTLFVPSSSTSVKPADPIAPPMSPEAVLKGQAESAWNSGNMNEAERLYGIVARHAATPPAEKALAFERLAMAALANKHAHTALDALEKWRAQSPGAEGSAPWLNIWSQAVATMPVSDQNRLANALWRDATRAAAARGVAGAGLFVRADALSRLALAQSLADLYNKAPNGDRQVMELGLLSQLVALDDEQAANLAAQPDASQDHVFPWSAVVLEQARRARKTASPEAETWLARIDFPRLFASPAVLDVARRGGSSYASVASGGAGAPGFAPVAPVPAIAMYSGCYALALPMSGPYSSIGWKVARGATAAQKELAQSGLNVEVMVVNTEAPDWLDQLASLPPQCVTVGGPLQPDAYANAKARGLVQNRAFFTYLSRLEGEDEGTTAWRFFSSPEDQVNAVLDFAKNVGITSFASLYPEDNFGQRMTDLFMQAVQRSGATMNKTASYNPGNQKAWNETVRAFVGAHMAGKVPVPSSSFQAVFLPDSWQSAETVVPYLFFHGEDRLLLMGTALWEQGLADKAGLDVRNLGLAVFPGAWNSATPSAAGSRLANALAGEEPVSADVWIAIGYDFVRFASALNLKAPWTPDMVNARIAEAQKMDWSMAPLSWNNGKAAQHLFLFTPAENGFVLADQELFKERLELVRSRHASRVGAARGAK